MIAKRRLQPDWARLAGYIAIAAISIAVGYLFQPMIHKNPNAVNTIVTIFSILAGFLIALITLIAEPVIQKSNSWQDLQMMQSTVHNQIFRRQLLFYFYLMTLGLALAMFLIPEDFPEASRRLEMVFLSLATFVFFASFALPSSLMKLQLQRYDFALKERQPEILRKQT